MTDKPPPDDVARPEPSVLAPEPRRRDPLTPQPDVTDLEIVTDDEAPAQAPQKAPTASVRLPLTVELVSAKPLRSSVPLPAALPLVPLDEDAPAAAPPMAARGRPFSRKRLAARDITAEVAPRTGNAAEPSQRLRDWKGSNAAPSHDFRARGGRSDTPPVTRGETTPSGLRDHGPEPSPPTRAGWLRARRPSVGARPLQPDTSPPPTDPAPTHRGRGPSPTDRHPKRGETAAPEAPRRGLFGPLAGALRPRRSPVVAAPSPALLVADNLTVVFDTPTGTQTAIDRASLTLERGKVLALVGESGAGKSALGAAFIGLIDRPGRIASGTVALDGRRIDDLSDRGLRAIRGRRIALVPQDPSASLNPLRSVGHQLVETILAHHRLSRRAARRRATELLTEVGVPGAGKRLGAYPHALSGGLRQRAVIALALAADPELVIADEPTAALDASVKAHVVALLRRIGRERGTAVLLISHDLGVVAEAADRVAVMYAGRIVEEGPAAEVLAAPRHPYTVGLIASVPRLDADAPRLPQVTGTLPGLAERVPGCPFAPRCPEAWARCFVDRPDLLASGPVGVACWLFEPEPVVETPPSPEPALEAEPV